MTHERKNGSQANAQKLGIFRVLHDENGLSSTLSSKQELLDAESLVVSDRQTRHFHPAIFLIALGAILLIYIALRLRHLGTYSLWCDEAFSVFVARSQWSDFFRQLF